MLIIQTYESNAMKNTDLTGIVVASIMRNRMTPPFFFDVLISNPLKLFLLVASIYY